MYYCPSFKKLGVKFCSELREDKTPSASIITWSGNLLYKDFGYPDHTFNCFSYVQFKFNVSFINALKIIDCDFNLNLSNKKEESLFTMGYLGYSQIQPKYIKKQTIIQKKRRAWNKDDAKFWRKYLVSKKILNTFAAGYHSIAMQSEMQIPDEKLISELKERFNTIEILYDNDFNKENNPGQAMANKICDLYGFKNICLPNELKSKDPSDLVNKVGNFNELKNILNDKR